MTWAAEGNEYTAKASNYTVTDALGTLTVTTSDVDVILTAASGNKPYDGTALTNATVTATGLPAGFTYQATASGSQTDAGSSANVVNDGYKFFDKDGKDKTANFTNVQKVNGTLTVTPIPVTIKTGTATKEYDGTPLTEGTVTIEGLVKGESVTLKTTGTITEVGNTDNTYSITWDKAKADNYTVTNQLGTLTVTANTAEVKLTAPSDEKVYDGTALTAPGTTEKPVTATGLPEGFTIEATASGSQTDAGNSANVVNDGYVIKNAAGEDRTANFTNVTKVNGTLTVTPKPVTITTGSDKKEYDGTPLTKAEATITGLVEGETYSLTATGTITEVGTTDNTYSMTWAAEGNDYTAKAGNYTVTDKLGTLEVTKNSSSKITVTAGSDSKTYDGKPLTNDEVTATGLPEGFTVVGTTEGSQTDAGKSDNTVASFKILDPNGEDKTANFLSVTTEKGTLEVTPKAVTITTGSADKEYDGTPLTNAEVKIEGLVDGESVTLTATGTQTEVGSSDNTYDIKWDKADSKNYTVTDKLGTLEVKKNTAEVTLTAASDEKEYDGTPLTNSEVTAAGLPEGFTIKATASGSQTNAGESANKVDEGYQILDPNGNDKTENFTNIKLEEGTLTVEKRPIIFTSATDKKAYDGTPLTNDEVTISGDGLAPTDEVIFNVTGSQTYVGESANTFTYSFEKKTERSGFARLLSALGILGEASADDEIAADDIAQNYIVTKVEGTLTVTDDVTPENHEKVVKKTHDDKTYQIGDTIEYTITVTNIYDEAKTITVVEQDDVVLNGSGVFENVGAGKSVTITAEHVVTEADVENGSFTNTVNAEFEGEKTHSDDDPVDKFAHMTVEKKVTNTPANGKTFVTGETIKYEITVTNDGTQDMTGIVVKDALTGDEWKVDSLAAGKSKTFKAEYKVTEKDAAAGSVTNVATAEGNDPDGDKTPVVPGDVTTKTDKAPEGGIPKTGDTTPIVEYTAMLGAALGLLLMIIRRRKERA